MKYKIYFTFLFLIIGFIATAQQQYLISGSYTTGKSEGIYVYLFNSSDGSTKEISHVKITNPSYLVVSPDEKFVYAVQEIADGNGNGGKLTAFSFNKKNGSLTFINEQLSGGDYPCYLSIDKTGRWVVTANYSSGTLTVLPIQTDGSLGEATTTIQHEGSGLIKLRQNKPHVHCTIFTPDNRFLLVSDLGIDKVMIYEFDESSGKLKSAKQPFAQSIAGSGPRHLSFQPSNKIVYLLEELSGTVVTFKYKNGRLKNIQRISSMPLGDTSDAGSADIHVSPDGNYLYASNRSGANSIAIFKVNKKNRKLVLIGHQSTLGKTPRNFNFDPSGNFLLVANQNSDEIVVFKRDKKTGLLKDTQQRIDAGNPVCIKWISLQ